MKELHARTQFVELTGSSPDKLAIVNYGGAGSGKTRLVATMPGKLGFIPLDRKSRRTMERAAAELKLPKGKIVFPKDDFVRLGKPMQLALMDPEAQMKFYREHVNRIKDALFSLSEKPDVDSIGIDTGTQLTEDVLFANYGRDQKIYPRDRGAFNSEMKQILAAVSNKHVIIPHESRSIWKNDKPTDKNEWVGWSKLDYNCNVIVEQTGPPATLKLDYKFGLTVRLCQDSPDLIGETILMDEDITFEMLATSIFPDGRF